MGRSRIAAFLDGLLNNNGQVTASGLASGAARANFGAGAVLQVVSAPRSPNSPTQGTTLATWIDTKLVGTITPTSETSKILVLVNQSFYFNNGGGSFPAIGLGLKRTIGGSSSLINIQSFMYFDNRGGGTLFGQQHIPASMSYLDSPNTASAITYTVQYRLDTISGSGISCGDSDASPGWGTVTPTITMIEVAA